MFLLVVASSLLMAPGGLQEKPTPFSFVRNDGQWHSQARFLAQTPNLDLWVTDDGLDLDFKVSNGQRRKGHVVKIRFDGTSAGAAFGTRPRSEVRNYMVGSPQEWATNVPTFSETEVRGISNGVDARYYFDGNVPRYDLNLRAGVDPSQIRMRYEGASNLRVGTDGLLRYDTSVGTVVEKGLFAYQRSGGGLHPVSAKPVVHPDQSVSFRVGAYDRTHPLVIDPTFSSPTTLGTIGSGVLSKAISTNDGGSVLVGSTTTSAYPATAGAYDTVWNGPKSGFITRSASNQSIVWTTYFGSNLDIRGVALDANEQPVVSGIAYANAFTATSGAFDTSYNGMEDGFAAKFDATGSSLLWATYAGGANHDGFHCVTLDPSGNVYLGGYTLGGFPVSVGAYDTTFKGDGWRDAAILKLSANGSTMLAGTYVGDEEPDTIYSILLDSQLNVYVGGQCDDADFPRSKSGVFDSIYGGPTEGFVCRLPNDLSKLNWATMIGGTNDDSVTCMAIKDDIIAVGGWTESSVDFHGITGTLGGEDDGFVLLLKTNGLAANGPPTGRYFGGNWDEAITSVGFGPDGTILALGYTNSTTGLDRIVTPDGLYKTRTGSETKTSFDSFVVQLSPDATTTVYGSLLGIAGSDKAMAGVYLNGKVRGFATNTVSSVVSSFEEEIDFSPAGPPQPELSSLALSANSVIGTPGVSGQLTGTVTLNLAASSDTVVTLASSNSAATVPTSVTVLTGNTQASFTINTVGVETQTTGSLTATLSSVSKSQDLSVEPVSFSLSLSAGSIVGNPGRVLGGTVTLGQIVNHSVTVSLSSFSSLATVPSSVTVPAGQISAPISVTSTEAVTATVTDVRVRGSYGPAVSDVLFDMLPPSVASVSLTPTSVTDGQTSTVTVTLASPAPTDGQVVPASLVYAGGANIGLPVPSSIASFQNVGTVAAGQTTATLQVLAGTVSQNTEVQAVVSGVSSNALTIVASGPTLPVIQAVTFNLSSGAGPKTLTGKVRLDAKAPASGMTVTLSCDNPNVQLSTTQVTMASTTTGTFTMTVPVVSEDTTVNVSAVVQPNDVPVVGTFTILRPTILSAAIVESAVAPGQLATVKVILNGKVIPGGMDVLIADDGTGRITFTKGTVLKILDGFSSGTLKVKVNGNVTPGSTIPMTATLLSDPPVAFTLQVAP
jgi:hypothetical protein